MVVKMAAVVVVVVVRSGCKVAAVVTRVSGDSGSGRYFYSKRS